MARHWRTFLVWVFLFSPLWVLSWRVPFWLPAGRRWSDFVVLVSGVGLAVVVVLAVLGVWLTSGRSTYRRTVLSWVLALSPLWVVFNWPMPFKGSFAAGVPWRFAFWFRGEPGWFDPFALIADVAVGLAVLVTLGALCVWLNEGRPPFGRATSPVAEGSSSLLSPGS